MEKLNKKGFTLVEILGVIVILSILVLLITAGIMGYFRKGKEDYNEKLKGQLVLAGKSYYSDHNNKLPIVNGKNYSYVTLPEMQSNNYITKKFVDSEGRECSPSYVYVKAKSYNSKEYDYIPCLICQDKDGNQISYSDSSYCQITNWDDKEAPKCGKKNADGSYETINANYSDSSITITDYYDNKQIKGIRVHNLNTNKELTKKLKDSADISSFNIKKEFKDFLKNNGRYEVTLIDEGGNESNTCVTFENSSTTNMCVAIQSGENLTITQASSSVGIKSFHYKTTDGLTKTLEETNSDPGETIINRDFDGVPKGATIYFVDKNNNTFNCQKQEIDASVTPICKFITSHSGETIRTKTTFQVECSMGGNYIEQNDLSKITTTNKFGKIVKTTPSPSNNQATKFTFDIEYKPTPGKNGNDEIMSIAAGLVKNPNNGTPNPPITTLFNVKTCIALPDSQYISNSSQTYANYGWTVVRDNDDSVSLAYNGVSGGGAYGNANSYLDNNFINPSEILKEAKIYGCLVDQGSNTYISTNSGTSSGYENAENYWTSSNSFYNNTNYIHHTVYKEGFVAGFAEDSNIPITTYTTSVADGAITNKGVISASSPNYSINGGTITFNNTIVTSHTSGNVSRVMQKYSLAPHYGEWYGKAACTASKTSLCGRNFRYIMSWNENTNITSYELANTSQQNGNNTSSATYYLCGGAYTNTTVYFKANPESDKTYLYSAIGNPESTRKYIEEPNSHYDTFAGIYITDCASSPNIGCTGNNPYARFYHLYDAASGCHPVTYYMIYNSQASLSYRPYIIVKKVK